MPVWIRVGIRVPGSSTPISTSAAANTMFSIGPRPLINLPATLAGRLGLDVRGARLLMTARDAGGRPLPVYELGVVEVRVEVPDRETDWVRAVAVHLGGSVVLLNDVLIEELGVVPERPGTGLWRFRDEPPDRLRRSAEPEYWP